MPIHTLCNSAMKSLFRKHQGHILLVLAQKHILTKHLESYEDYPKELSENCLRFSPMADETTDINNCCILKTAGIIQSLFWMPQTKTGQEVSNYGSLLTHCLDVLNVQQRLSGNAV